MARLFALLLCLLPTLPATLHAQAAPRTILVLDGSGSMWGQIDGVNKIVIAREVMGDLLDTLPDDLELGLMSYGHRRKGDCSDIEMLIEPGVDRAAIAAAVNAINPKGKTPLSAAVIQAAQALRYTEEAATVILVSDGIETCELDPCAVGRELEETGVGFTAHVIGFDVAEPEALAQLQCLAEETGGSFRPASNAEELAEALEVVAVAPEPEPAPDPVRVTFRALDGEGGAVIGDGLIWTIATKADGALMENGETGTPAFDILPGTGTVEVLRVIDEATAEAAFTVTESEGASNVVTLVLPEFRPPATLDAPESAPAGSLVPVTWEGPGGENDFLTSADDDMGGSFYHHYVYTRDGEANVAQLRMPPEPGDYVIRYILDEGNKVLAERAITVTPLEIVLTPPDAATIGDEAPVGWVGPDYENDYITVSRPDQGDEYYVSYEYTRNGTPLAIRMPGEPGAYELRYVLGASRHVAARISFDVADTATSVSGPASAPAGATIPVEWIGPDAQNDYVAIAPAGADDSAYESYTYTKAGNPAALKLPLEPGDYELRYVLNVDREVLARAPISLTEISATLDGPDSAPAGSQLSIGWEGPDYDRDFVTVTKPDARESDYLGYAYTGNGNPAEFQAPTEPGTYELRYVANGARSDRVIARRAITIEAVTAELSAPASIGAGAPLSVDWQGPGDRRDYIALAEPGADLNRYVTYAYARELPAEMQAPATPGTYELRYVQHGTPSKLLATVPLEVTAVTASLDAPARVAAGTAFSVSWQGPSGQRDYVTIAKPDEQARKYEDYAYARNGSPSALTAPEVPGSYELRYVLDGPDTEAVLARRQIIVE